MGEGEGGGRETERGARGGWAGGSLEPSAPTSPVHVVSKGWAQPPEGVMGEQL